MKTLEEAFELLEEVSLNAYQWQSDRPARGIYENHSIDTISALSAQMEALGRKMDNLNAFHTDCQVSNSFIHYSDQANFVGDFQENNNFQEPSHPGFAPQEEHSDLEDLLKSYINSNETKLKNQENSIKSLETQVGQLVNLLYKRIHEDLPSNIETKPMEKVCATTLRCGRELEEPIKELRQELVKETVETQKGEESSSVVPKVKAALEVEAYKPRVPFLARLVQHKLDKEFSKFPDVFKKLHINIPFADAIAQMPSYAKFLKEILKNKRKLEDFEILRL